MRIRPQSPDPYCKPLVKPAPSEVLQATQDQFQFAQPSSEPKPLSAMSQAARLLVVGAASQATTPPTEVPSRTDQRLNLPDFSAEKPKDKIQLVLRAAANATYLALLSGGGILAVVSALQGHCSLSNGALYLAGAVAGAAGLFGGAAGLVGKNLVPSGSVEDLYDSTSYSSGGNGSDSGPSCQ